MLGGGGRAAAGLVSSLPVASSSSGLLNNAGMMPGGGGSLTVGQSIALNRATTKIITAPMASESSVISGSSLRGFGMPFPNSHALNAVGGGGGGAGPHSIPEGSGYMEHMRRKRQAYVSPYAQSKAAAEAGAGAPSASIAGGGRKDMFGGGGLSARLDSMLKIGVLGGPGMAAAGGGARSILGGRR